MADRQRVMCEIMLLLGLSAGMLAAEKGGISSDAAPLGSFEEGNEISGFAPPPPGRWSVGGGAIGELSPMCAHSGRHSLKVSFSGKTDRKSWPYAKTTIPKHQRDLSSHRFLQAFVYNPTPYVVVLQGKLLASNAALWTKWKLRPGWNHPSIPIAEDTMGKDSKDSNLDVPFDWSGVESLMFFLDCPAKDVILYIDDVQCVDSKTSDSPSALSNRRGEVQASEFETSPDIDGELDDSVWANAMRTPLFRGNMDGERPGSSTYALLGYDADTLYVAIVCEEANCENLRKRGRGADAFLWNDDEVEVFLSNEDGPAKTYYQFCANAGTGFFDAISENGAFDAGWNRDWRHATKVKGDKWQAEFAIPLHIFKYDPKNPLEWRINIARNHPGRKKIYALFPTGMGLHMPEKFGEVIGFKNSFDAYSLTLRSSNSGNVKIGHDTLTAIIENGSATSGNYTFGVGVFNAGGKVDESKVVKRLKPGLNTVNLTYHIHSHGEYDLVTRVENDSGKPILEWRDIISTPPPIKISFSAPFYKNCIYASEKSAEIRGELSLNVQDELLAGATILAALRDAAGKPLSQKKIELRIDKAIYPFAFPASCLPGAGRYQLSVTLLDSKGSEIARRLGFFRKLPHRDNEIRIGRGGTILVDGKPFFKICAWYGTPVWFEKLRDVGFNTVFLIEGFHPPEKFAERYQLAKDSGMMIVSNIGLATIQSKYHDEVDFSTVRDKIARLVGKMESYPALFSYDLLDEPGCYNRRPLPGFVNAYRLISELDPYHPVSITQNAESDMSKEYEKSCDIMAVDWYPGFQKRGECCQPLSWLPIKIRTLRKTVSDDTAISVVLQGYDRIRDTDILKKGRLANYRELRCMAYSCVAEGAVGVEFWCFNQTFFGCMAGYPEWFGIAAVTRELSQMAPVLATANIHGAVSVSNGDAETHASAKEYCGARYVVVVNSSKRRRELEIEAPVFKNLASVKVSGESRNVSVHDGKFSDTFDQYDVHVYTDAEDMLYSGNIENNEKSAKAAIDEFERKNRQNLLYAMFEDEIGSVKVSASSSLDTQNKHLKYFTLDGFRNTYWRDDTPNSFPDWLEYELDTSVKASKIVIISSVDFLNDRGNPIRDFKFQIYDDGHWETVDEIKGNTAARVEISFPPRRVRKFRILVEATDGKYSYIDEVQLFAK